MNGAVPSGSSRLQPVQTSGFRFFNAVVKVFTAFVAINSIAFVALPVAWAQAPGGSTPVGLWRSIDDKTGQPKAEIRIRANSAGVLSGVVEKALAPSDDLLCTECPDDRKDKPKLGLEIIRGANKADDRPAWEGGTIIDPDNGRIYKLRLTPADAGNKLEVRGAFGPFWRTQTWIRIQ